MSVKHLSAEGSVKTFDVGVLSGLAGLDVMEFDAVALTLSYQLG